jgi:hypothetical protein
VARDTRDNPHKPQYAIQKHCAGRAKREFPRSRKNNGLQSQCKAQNATSELNSKMPEKLGENLWQNANPVKLQQNADRTGEIF